MYRKTVLSRTITGYAFVLPAMILIFAFMIIPIFMTGYMSLFNKTLVKNDFIAFANYARLLGDKKFLNSLLHTFTYVGILVPTVVLTAMLLSSIIVRKSHRVGAFYRGLFYIPTIASAVTVSVIWNWVFNPVAGVANYLITTLGGTPLAWFSDRILAFFCVCLVAFVGLIGQPIILYTAAMNGVSIDYYEAASLDGANAWVQFWKVTVPEVRPTTLYVTIITAINAFQLFIPIQLLTKGGPVNSTTSLMYTLYTTAFTDNKYGYASAMGVILLVFLATFSIVQFRVQQKKD